MSPDPKLANSAAKANPEVATRPMAAAMSRRPSIGLRLGDS
jgi:hypothetical protein